MMIRRKTFIACCVWNCPQRTALNLTANRFSGVAHWNGFETQENLFPLPCFEFEASKNRERIYLISLTYKCTSEIEFIVRMLVISTRLRSYIKTRRGEARYIYV